MDAGRKRVTFKTVLPLHAANPWMLWWCWLTTSDRRSCFCVNLLVVIARKPLLLRTLVSRSGHLQVRLTMGFQACRGVGMTSVQELEIWATFAASIDRSTGAASALRSGEPSESVLPILIEPAQRSTESQRKLRRHLRRGVISLINGLAFLATTLSASRRLGGCCFARTLRHSLEISGWVSLWRRMEIFLYDGCPFWATRSFIDAFARVPVQIRYSA